MITTLCDRRLTEAVMWQDVNEKVILNQKAELVDALFSAVPEGTWASVRWYTTISTGEGCVESSLVMDVSDDRNELENMLEGRLDRSYSRGATLERLCVDMYELIKCYKEVDVSSFSERMEQLGLLEGEDNAI